jgi:glyoxylase-like metal-dependent hydrolase (beta-lactamase superfamily II)
MSAVVQLAVIDVAHVPIPLAYLYRRSNRLAGLAAVLRPGGETVLAPCRAYVVRHPSAGTILIDTGLHPDASRALRVDFGRPMALVFRGLKPADRPYADQLRALGVDAADVERVIMTHLHVDHTSGMRSLEQATFICARDEWAAAHARGAVANGYVGHHLPPAARIDLVDFENRGEPYGPFTSTLDLLGDGSIRLLSTPGHTRGHMSVLLRVTGDRQVLVVGDALYTLRNMREELLPLLTADDARYLSSLRELKAFADQEPDAILIPSHDPEAAAPP